MLAHCLVGSALLSLWRIMCILYSRFVLMHLPGKITYKEIDEMITTVDKGRRHKNIYGIFHIGRGA